MNLSQRFFFDFFCVRRPPPHSNLCINSILPNQVWFSFAGVVTYWPCNPHNESKKKHFLCFSLPKSGIGSRFSCYYDLYKHTNKALSVSSTYSSDTGTYGMMRILSVQSVIPISCVINFTSTFHQELLNGNWFVWFGIWTTRAQSAMGN